MVNPESICVKFYLCDWNMYSVLGTRYCQRLISIFKKIIGREYNPSNKTWSFPLKSYKYLLELVREIDKVKITKELTEDEINSFQCIITNEEDNNFEIDLPFNELGIQICQNNNGLFDKQRKKWSFKNEKKESLIDGFNSLGIMTKYLKNKPKSLKIFF